MNPELLISKGFEALQYVTNPYALFAYIFLGGMVGIGIFVRHKIIKASFLMIFAALALGAAYSLVYTLLANIEEQVKVHLVRRSNRPLVAPGIEIELLDIETLKGRGDWNFNFQLDDGDHVFDEVFARAGVTPPGWTTRAEMDTDKWTEFLTELEESGDAEKCLQAEKIKDIPFAKFRVFVDGAEDPTLGDKYYFKNDMLCVPLGSSACGRAKLRIVNIYNTKHHSSGEPEALNIRVFRE